MGNTASGPVSSTTMEEKQSCTKKGKSKASTGVTDKKGKQREQHSGKTNEVNDDSQNQRNGTANDTPNNQKRKKHILLCISYRPRSSSSSSTTLGSGKSGIHIQYPVLFRRAKRLPLPLPQLVPEIRTLPFDSVIPAPALSSLLKLSRFIPVLPHIPCLVANVQRNRRRAAPTTLSHIIPVIPLSQAYFQLRDILERSPLGQRLVGLLFSLYGPLSAIGVEAEFISHEWVVDVILALFELFDAPTDEIPRRCDVRTIVKTAWPMMGELQSYYKDAWARSWGREVRSAKEMTGNNATAAAAAAADGHVEASSSVFSSPYSSSCSPIGPKLPNPNVIAKLFCAIYMVETWRRRPGGLVSTGEVIDGLWNDKFKIFEAAKEVYVLVGALGPTWLWRWTTVVMGMPAAVVHGTRVEVKTLNASLVVFVVPEVKFKEGGNRGGVGVEDAGIIQCDIREGLLATVRTTCHPLLGLSIWEDFEWKGQRTWGIMDAPGQGAQDCGGGCGAGAGKAPDVALKSGHKRNDSGLGRSSSHPGEGDASIDSVHDEGPSSSAVHDVKRNST